MFSKNLKRIRLAKGLSQQKLADILSVSVKTISHWESDYSEPSIEMLVRLKNLLDISYEELLEDTLV